MRRIWDETSQVDLAIKIILVVSPNSVSVTGYRVWAVVMMEGHCREGKERINPEKD